MKKKGSAEMSVYLHLEKDATWTAQFAQELPGPGFVWLCRERTYPVEFYYKRYDMNGSAVFERDVCSNREELLESLSWCGSCHNAVRALWDFDSSQCLDAAIHKLFNDAYVGKMDKIREEFASSAKEDMKDILQTLAEDYGAFSSLEEVAYFSSQDLNIDLVGCVKEALANVDPSQVNYVAKFVLQHLNHYVEFCEAAGSKEDLAAMDQLLRDIRTSHGSSLEASVLLHYDYLADVSLADLFSKASLSQQIDAAAQRSQKSAPDIGKPAPEHDR